MVAEYNLILYACLALVAVSFSIKPLVNHHYRKSFFWIGVAFLCIVGAIYANNTILILL